MQDFTAYMLHFPEPDNVKYVLSSSLLYVQDAWLLSFKQRVHQIFKMSLYVRFV